jgi:hypothetical protein
MPASFRAQIKSLLNKWSPTAYAALIAPISRARYRRFQLRAKNVDERVARKFGCAVQTGPFAGMRYLERVTNGGVSSKVLGCYEAEIAHVVESVRHAGYETIIDVGCAEGYYAVGFALMAPESRVLAFDEDELSRTLCCEMAELNGVSRRLSVAGACSHASLHGVASDSVFLLCDCEGFELELLDPAVCPQLRRWDVLVELHEMVHAGLTATLLRRFEDSHEIELFDTQDRDWRKYPLTKFLRSKADRRAAISDLRGSFQQWAWMKARRR